MEVSQECRGWLFSASSGGLLSFSRYYLSCRRLAQKLSASNWIVQTKKTPLKAIITEYCNVSSKLNTSDVSSKGESKYLQRHLEIFFFFHLVCRNFCFWKWKSILRFKSIGSYLVSWLWTHKNLSATNSMDFFSLQLSQICFTGGLVIWKFPIWVYCQLCLIGWNYFAAFTRVSNVSQGSIRSYLLKYV